MKKKYNALKYKNQEIFYDLGGSRHVDGNIYNFDYNMGSFPMLFNLKVSILIKWRNDCNEKN